MYNLLRDAEFRLRGTILWYGGDHNSYARVVDVYKNNGVITLLLNSGDEEFSADLKDPELVLRNIPLGYVILGDRAVYIKRKACRAYRQGLRHDNIVITGIGGNRIPTNEFDRQIARGEVRTTGRIQTRDGEVVVINKDIIALDNKLFYRGREVGAYAGGNPYLHNSKIFLKELVAEAQVQGA